MKLLWTMLFAAASLVWANPILDPGAPDGLTLYQVSSVPSLAGSFEGIAIGGGNLLVSLANPLDAGGQTIWSMPLVRNNGHITSVGAASLYGTVSAGTLLGSILGGGLVTVNGGVLYTTQGQNLLGQYINGTAATPLAIDLGARSLGGMNYVPAGLPGAGQLKVSSISDGSWYTLTLAGTPGSYSVSSVTPSPVGGPPVGIPALSFDYLPADATFAFPSVVLGNGQYLDMYHLDANGNPCKAPAAGCTNVVHLVDSSLGGGVGMGVVRDPLSGDILFSTDNNQIWLLSDTIPEPSTLVLAIGGMALLATSRLRSRCRCWRNHRSSRSQAGQAQA